MKRIKGFENYMISSAGEVVNAITGKMKTPTSNHTGKGYMYVDLYNNKHKKRFYVHRLVAKYYIDNPLNKPYVNHIDGNPQNNIVSNLEWCTPEENVEHAAKVLNVMKQYEKANNRRKKPIKCTNITTNEVKTFTCIRDAERELKIPSPNIVSNLKGRTPQTHGFICEYI